MSAEIPIGVIELDDINIKCIIFKINSNDETEILSVATTSSEGIHNDIIINLTKASNAVRSCISNAEKKAKVSLKKINVLFEQPDFLSTKFSKSKKIDGSKIHKDDIDFLLKEAKKQLIHNDKNQSIIHIFNHNYVVDGKTFVEEPIGIFADSLTHEMTFITMPKNNMKNIEQVFVNCDIEIERLISRIFALGAKIINNKDLQSGSVLIDLGFEKTSLGLFKNLALIHSITFPIGLNHIAKDISKVCSLNLNEAKNVISNIDFSFERDPNIFDDKNFLKKDYFIDSNFRKISKNLIMSVIKSRLDEIIYFLKKQLIVPGFNLKSGVSFYLRGGLNFINLDKYFTNFFGTNFNKNENNSNKKDIDYEKGFDSCSGAILIIKDGWETEAIPKITEKTTGKNGFFSKFFRIR